MLTIRKRSHSETGSDSDLMDSENEDCSKGVKDDDMDTFINTNNPQKPCLKENSNPSWVNRIIQDYKDFGKFGGPWGISAQIMNDDVRLWSVQILGPIGTPYEGGFFQGILQFSELFPFTPPTFTFLTSVFHPNISEDGVVCLDQLHSKWTPCHTVWSLLLSVQFFLADANPEKPLNHIAAEYYLSNREQFEEIVEECVKKSMEELKNESNSFRVMGPFAPREVKDVKIQIEEDENSNNEEEAKPRCQIESRSRFRAYYSTWKDRMLLWKLKSTDM